MLIRVLDLETTGEAPDILPIEIGWCDLVPVYHADDVPHHWEIGTPKWILCDPGVPVSPESSGVNHITTEMVIGMEDPPTVIGRATDVAHDAIFVAHNADFEKSIIGDLGHQWIDTYKVAVKLAPMAPSFKLQVLRYWLKLDIKPGYPVHRAGPDAYVTAVMLMRMLAKMTVEEMIAVSSQPVYLPRLFFGKHAKEPIAEVPESYLTWIINEHAKNGGFEGNVLFTATSELNRRRNKEKLL